MEFLHESTIKDLSNEDDIVQYDQKDVESSEGEKQEDQHDSVKKFDWIFFLVLILGLISLFIQSVIFFKESEGAPILILLASIVGIVGARKVRSNPKIGGIIMMIAAIIHLFGTSTALVAIFGLGILFVGLWFLYE